VRSPSVFGGPGFIPSTKRGKNHLHRKMKAVGFALQCQPQQPRRRKSKATQEVAPGCPDHSVMETWVPRKGRSQGQGPKTQCDGH
jgi:hypothetical protein